VAYGCNDVAPDAKKPAKKWVATYAYSAVPRTVFSPLWYNSRRGFSVSLLAGEQAFGQITASDIVGTVSDATGAVVMTANKA
jgi:hypothetical protein